MFTIMLRTLFEFAMIILLVYGYMHEKEIIEIEQLLWKVIVIKYRQFKRNRKLAKMRKNREFKVVNGRAVNRDAKAQSLHVA